MRFRSLKKWDDPAACATLVYFAQLLDEMLFDFSLDTYKASVMHTGLLCREALQTIKEVDAGNIKAPNVGHVVSELVANFEKDPVALSLSPLPLNAFLPILKNPKTQHRELSTALELLALQTTPDRYRKKAEELLVSEVTKGGSISEIRRLTRIYITSLISSGFSPTYLQQTTKDYFYYGDDRIKSVDAIGGYFDKFPDKRSEFVVIFRLHDVFEHMAEAFSSFGVEITRKPPSGFDLTKYKSFTANGDDKLYGVVSKVEALDPYSARLSAEHRLKLCSTLISIFHHKEIPSWMSECVIRETSSGASKVIRTPMNSMLKCSDMTQSVASNRLKLLMSEFSLEQNSFMKFIRSAQLHSMALRSDFEENQILNLWIALESLVPSETKGEDVSNIEHIVDSLIPFLNIGYFEKLLTNLGKDLLRWNHTATRKALKLVPGQKISDKLVKLLVLSQFDAERAALENEFRDFHLLSDRFSYFRTVLSNPGKVMGALDAHRLRLEWQIRRIYRARNIIVHSGHTPSYTRSLIEHAHDYLDTVLAHLVALASRPKKVNSVAQGFKHVKMRYEMYCKGLSQKGLVFDSTNIDALVLGRQE
ncbi:hypothetical protein DM40_1003 [Burkholderia cenocepacia]|nr:hypothetical protein DM40_1003 [Burkholderia cenocepacia]